MGFGKKKRMVREGIAKWDCFGYLGYGQGRAVAQFGEKELHGKSACYDICSRASTCRDQHHDKMNERYPQLGQMVETASRIAKLRGLDVVAEVVSAMTHAVDLGIDEAQDVRHILDLFKIDGMTDHYRCGQFENIQDGLNKVKPGARSAVAEAQKKAS